MIAAKKGQTAHIANENGTPWSATASRLAQHLQQIVDVREVLHNRIEYDGIEARGGQATEIIGRPYQQLGRIKSRNEQAPSAVLDLAYRGCREIRAAIARTMGNESVQEETGATADLQQRSRCQLENTCNRIVDRFVHFMDRKRVAGKLAVPSR